MNDKHISIKLTALCFALAILVSAIAGLTDRTSRQAAESSASKPQGGSELVTPSGSLQTSFEAFGFSTVSPAPLSEEKEEKERKKASIPMSMQ